MERYRWALAMAVSSEAKAYGFILVVWGTGALEIHANGIPTPTDVFAYVGGALAAMMLVVFAAFGRPRDQWTRNEGASRYAYGALHVVSPLAALASGWAVATTVGGSPSYSLAGLVAVLVFQCLLGLEILGSIAEKPSS